MAIAVQVVGSNLIKADSGGGFRWSEFNKAVSVADLAQMTGMSISSSNRAFKSATGSSHLQFRTQLQLHEARRTLLFCGSKACTIAFEVEYDNPSQFNREYRRIFGGVASQRRGNWNGYKTCSLK